MWDRAKHLPLNDKQLHINKYVTERSITYKQKKKQILTYVSLYGIALILPVYIQLYCVMNLNLSGISPIHRQALDSNHRRSYTYIPIPKFGYEFPKSNHKLTIGKAILFLID